MGMVKVMARATSKRTLLILKETLEKAHGTVFTDGPFPDREGKALKIFFTFEIKEAPK